MATAETALASQTETAERFQTPVNTSPPTVSPSGPKTGTVETATTGTWTEAPTKYTYQWRRCNASGLECVDIAGATASTYYPLEADIEKTLVVKVTASNAAGSTSASSAATEKVTKAGIVTETPCRREVTRTA